MHEFVVVFSIRKGLGPDWFPKHISVCIDDPDPEMSEADIRASAIADAESTLYRSEDFRDYGKNWVFVEIHHV